MWEQGGAIERERYTPFGITLDNPASLKDQAGFTGHIKDSATRLNYMQARYYDPVMGRFLSIDPVTFLDKGEPSFFNRYRYCANDPVNCTNPTGMNDYLTNIIKDNIPTKDQVVGAVAGIVEGAGQAVADTLQPNSDTITVSSDTSGIIQAPASVEGQQGKIFGKAAVGIGSVAVTKGRGLVKSPVTKSSLKRVKKLIRNLSDNSRKGAGLNQTKANQFKRIIKKAGGSVRVDGTTGTRGSSAGVNHMQVEGLGGKMKSRHVWLEPGVE